MALRIPLFAALICSAAALAQEPVPAAPPVEAPAATVVPPEALEIPEIPYPPDAPETKGSVEVGATIVIDASGAVKSAEIVVSGGEPFDRAVLEGVKSFRFKPATYGGQPVEVQVPYTHTFVAPAREPVAADEGPERDAVLEGLVQIRGTRAPLANAVVIARVGEHEFTATTDEAGKFSLPLPSGEAELRISAVGYRRFLQKETLRAGDHVKLRYLVDRQSYDPYETVVVGTRERTEISRTTLEGREITRVPGTFGDPFRVVMVLPGVTSVMSLLPMPVVRGSSPGNTGFFLDGVRLPLLFHLLGGPAVVHPEFIDRIDFFPGGFPVQYGGYTGGIVDGITRRAKPDERTFDLDLNLAQTGVFGRYTYEPLGVSVTAGGRIGYPGVLMSLVTSDASLDYWDYQLRLDGGTPGRAWSAFFFGAKDELRVAPEMGKPLETVLRFAYHRADFRYRLGHDARHAAFRFVAGWDDTRIGGEDSGTRAWVLGPQARGEWRVSDELNLSGGLDLAFRDSTMFAPSQEEEGGEEVSKLLEQKEGLLTTGAAYAEAQWKPRDGLLVIPGVRTDVYDQKDTRKWGFDPRLMVRWRLSDAKVGGTWLKGVVGRFHQPPRFPFPIPGLDQSALDLGLLESTQASIGAEVKLAPGVELDVATYYNHMDPVMFDLTVNPGSVQPGAPTSLPGQEPTPDDHRHPEDESLDNLFTKRKGRSYGLEVMLRKRDTKGFFGWVSYTLSRSERRVDGRWSAFDFDRLHILNVVGGLRLPRNWEVGSRLMLQTGTPLTTIYGHNAGRSDSQLRIDLRIDKRAVWNEWLLDFYVDVVNVSVASESGGLVGGDAFRYLMPTLGFRAVF